jgi:hypothetical protein
MDTRFEGRNRDARFLAYSSHGVTTDVELEKDGSLIVLRTLQKVVYNDEFFACHHDFVWLLLTDFLCPFNSISKGDEALISPLVEPNAVDYDATHPRFKTTGVAELRKVAHDLNARVLHRVFCQIGIVRVTQGETAHGRVMRSDEFFKSTRVSRLSGFYDAGIDSWFGFTSHGTTPFLSIGIHRVARHVE